MIIVDTHCHAGMTKYEPVESLLRHMETSGVAQAVLIQYMGNTDNEYLADCLARFPGQLAAAGTYHQAWNDLRDALIDTAPLAEEMGAAIGVENVWNKFLLSPLEARLFIDEVGSDWVGIYLDTANMMAYGYPEHWIRELGERIKKVHFKDFLRREHRFVNLRDGDTDWPAIMAELRAVGYDSTLIHEVGGCREDLVDLGERMRDIAAL